LHDLFRFLEWREGFLTPKFCSYDDLRVLSLTHKTLRHHWISVSKGNFRQLRCLENLKWWGLSSGFKAWKGGEGHGNPDSTLEWHCLLYRITNLLYIFKGH
jgi:hypothetical protein